VSGSLALDNYYPEKNIASSNDDKQREQDPALSFRGGGIKPLIKENSTVRNIRPLATLASGGTVDSEMILTEQQQYMIQTPTSTTAAAFSEAKSFVNGLLSPFSPLLTKEDLSREERIENLQFVSLQPCRKVSVVVRVLPVKDGENDMSNGPHRCVFSHYKDEIDQTYQPNRSTNDHQQQEVATSSPSFKRIILPRDMVVVNPSAFGKHIPSLVRSPWKQPSLSHT
jgi:hypothetical protein